MLISGSNCRLLSTLLLTLAVAGIAHAAPSEHRDIRLVLQLTVDGLRADLINRYEFGDGGFELSLIHI